MINFPRMQLKITKLVRKTKGKEFSRIVCRHISRIFKKYLYLSWFCIEWTSSCHHTIPIENRILIPIQCLLFFLIRIDPVKNYIWLYFWLLKVLDWVEVNHSKNIDKYFIHLKSCLSSFQWEYSQKYVFLYNSTIW